MTAPKFHFTISLAQWSLHQAFFSGALQVLDFPCLARERYGIGAIEYVNQFFMDKAQDHEFLGKMKAIAKAAAVDSLLIMVDHEGALAATDVAERQNAVERHRKWIEAAAFLECRAVRVNLHGSTIESDWVNGSIESLTALGTFAAGFGLKVLVENHGQLSSKINLLVDAIRGVNLPNVGTLPDFGNFCIRSEASSNTQKPRCIEQYDTYQGIEEMLPFAGGISAKTSDFDESGNESSLDFERIMALIERSGYHGAIAVEYQGDRLSEDAGIRLSKKLLERWKM